jgi:hypothetical protein
MNEIAAKEMCRVIGPSSRGNPDSHARSRFAPEPERPKNSSVRRPFRQLESISSIFVRETAGAESPPPVPAADRAIADEAANKQPPVDSLFDDSTTSRRLYLLVE